jgi:hypothetical protein
MHLSVTGVINFELIVISQCTRRDCALHWEKKTCFSEMNRRCHQVEKQHIWGREKSKQVCFLSLKSGSKEFKSQKIVSPDVSENYVKLSCMK